MFWLDIIDSLKFILQIVYVVILIILDCIWILDTIDEIKRIGIDSLSFKYKLCFVINGVLLLILTIWLWF